MRSIFRKLKGWVIHKLSGLWKRVVYVLIAMISMRAIWRKFKAWIIPKFSFFQRHVVPVLIITGGILFVLGLILFIYLFPEWQVEKLGTIRDPKIVGELVNQYRTTWAQIIEGFFVLVGPYLGWQRVEVAREGQITDRFTRAVDQLGKKDQIEIRLGGIYALERIARDSQKDHWTVMEVLTAYVRTRSP